MEKGTYKFQITAKLGLVFFALLASCSSSKSGSGDPKSRLQDYISQSFAVTSAQDRDSLSRFLTGPAKTRLAAWSDEQFKSVF